MFRLWAGLLCLLIFSIAPCCAQTSPFVVVSAASYKGAVSPSSLAAIFGSGLATSTASATLDASGQLPTQLANVSVEIGGIAAPLIYVSQTQINLVIPDSVATGTANVVVHTPLGTSLTGTVLVGDTAPGLFSLDATGTGAGAILNGVTFAPAPFLVETAANAGSDKRTRLSVYATGIRYAGNPTHDPSMTNVANQVTLLAHDAAGNPYTVEFAGAAPGFFGLDQLNIVLPPEMDGAGTVSLVVSTDSGGSSNTVTFQVNSLPANAIHLAGLTLSPAIVTAGGTVTATVTLNGRASVGGITAAIQSTSTAAQPPFSVNIPQGTASAQFTFGTNAVISTQTASITARAGGTSQSASLEIDPTNALQLQSFTVDATTIQGGRSISLTATLNASAPVNGVVIPLTSDNAAIKVPATLKIPFGQQFVTVSVPTTVVSTAQTANLTAALGRTTQSIAITVNPPFTLTLSSNSVKGGNTVAGTFTLTESTPTVSSVTLRSTDPSVQIQPAVLTISSNQMSGTFTVTTVPVTTSKTVTISATSTLYTGITQTVFLTVTPPTAAQLQSVTIAPSIVTGGQTASGLVTLTDPAPITGVPVTLKTSDLQHAQLVQQFVIVLSGQTSAPFTITTSPVTSPQTVTITATANGTSKSAVVTVQ